VLRACGDFAALHLREFDLQIFLEEGSHFWVTGTDLVGLLAGGYFLLVTVDQVVFFSLAYPDTGLVENMTLPDGQKFVPECRNNSPVVTGIREWPSVWRCPEQTSTVFGRYSSTPL
jgi:hypothetical protein